MTELIVGDVSPRVQYTADGSQTSFAYPFPVFSESDLAVYFDAGDDPSPFTVDGAGQSAGGNVVFDAAPPAGTRVTIVRQMPIERASDFQEAGDFRAAAINQELDRLTMMVQQVDEKVGRAVGVEVHAVAGDLTLPPPDAKKYLRWDAAGAKLEAVAPLDASNVAVTGFGESLIDDTDAAAARATLGLGAAAVENVAVGGSGDLLRADGDGSNLAGIGGAAKNVLINGCMTHNQRNDAAARNDDTYGLDRWLVISDGNGVVTATQDATGLPAGARRAMKLTWQVAGKQAGIVQVVEGANARHLIGGAVSLSFRAKASGLANLRAAVLAWDGSEDAVTSDVVSAWAGAGTNPTWAANWTAENAPSNLDVSGGAWTGFKIENVAVDTANAENLAVVVWLDDTDAAINDTLLITDVQLEPGAAATGFGRRPVGQELALCRRYYQRFRCGWIGRLVGTGASYGASASFPIQMRSAPTVVSATDESAADKFSAAATGDLDTLNVYGCRFQRTTTGADGQSASWHGRYGLEAEL